jgi:Glu-tRNA(Gln) amidotransferase subunit E-like FAD-binding protein
MAYYHSQKAFYYYTEFIGQITGDQNVFLQLTSRDAMMFVYKKTIFEIHNDYKKSNVLLSDLTNENEKMEFLDAYVQIIKNLVIHSILTVDFKNIKQNEVSYKTTVVDKIDHICEFVNKCKIPLNLFMDIKYLVEYLTNNSITENYYEVIQKYIIKVIKNTESTDSNENIKDKIHTYFQVKNKIEDVDAFISKVI